MFFTCHSLRKDRASRRRHTAKRGQSPREERLRKFERVSFAWKNKRAGALRIRRQLVRRRTTVGSKWREVRLSQGLTVQPGTGFPMMIRERCVSTPYRQNGFLGVFEDGTSRRWKRRHGISFQ